MRVEVLVKEPGFGWVLGHVMNPSRKVMNCLRADVVCVDGEVDVVQAVQGLCEIFDVALHQRLVWHLQAWTPQ
jgi:hypothetical protein